MMGSRDETSSTLILETLAVVPECQNETGETEVGGQEAKIKADAEVGVGEKVVKVVDQST